MILNHYNQYHPCSGKDMMLSNITEDGRLHRMLQRCEIRSFIGNGDPLFLVIMKMLLPTQAETNKNRGKHCNYIH